MKLNLNINNETVKCYTSIVPESVHIAAHFDAIKTGNPHSLYFIGKDSDNTINNYISQFCVDLSKFSGFNLVLDNNEETQPVNLCVFRNTTANNSKYLGSYNNIRMNEEHGLTYVSDNGLIQLDVMCKEICLGDGSYSKNNRTEYIETNIELFNSLYDPSVVKTVKLITPAS